MTTKFIQYSLYNVFPFNSANTYFQVPCMKCQVIGIQNKEKYLKESMLGLTEGERKVCLYTISASRADVTRVTQYITMFKMF